MRTISERGVVVVGFCLVVVGKGLRIGEMGFRLAEVMVVVEVAEDRGRLWCWCWWRWRKKKGEGKGLDPEKMVMGRFERVNWMDRV